MQQESFNLLHERMIGLEQDHHPQYHEINHQFVSGRYYCGNNQLSQASTFSPTKNTVYAWSFKINRVTFFDRVSLNVASAIPGANIYLAAYADIGDTSAPGALLFALGSVSAATTGIKEIVFGSIPIGISTFWIALNCDADLVLLTSQAKTEVTARFGADDPSTGENAVYVYDGTGVSGSFNNPFDDPQYAADGNYPLYMRCSN